MSEMSSGNVSGVETGTATGPAPARPRREPAADRPSALETERGSTTIADAVVAKIAGLAAREIPGVHSLGSGLSKAIGSLRSRVGQDASMTQGVGVEVGQRQAAVDLDLITFYGQSIVAVSDAVRENVVNRLESMTGLDVTEVNITVDDLYVEGDEDGQEKEARVQ